MTYVRPHLELSEFRDASGALIDYGRRWGSGPPPEDTYSVLRWPGGPGRCAAEARALFDPRV